MANDPLFPADRGTIDRIKGVLILAVIAAHNDAVSLDAPWLRQLAYYFHVQGFFLLSSFLDTQQMSLQFLRDRAVRYLVPHAAFVVLGALAFGAMQSGTEPATLIHRLWTALLLGNDQSLHAATGMHFLWFLPCLFCFCIIKAAANRWTWFRRPMVLLAWLWLPVAGLFSAESFAWVPYSMQNAVFFFGFGELAKGILRITAVGRIAVTRWFAPLMALGLAALIVMIPLGWVSAANVTTYDIRRPLTWGVALVFPCVMLLALSAGLATVPGKVLEACGRYSMPLYLVHMFVYRGLTRAWFGGSFRSPTIVGGDVRIGLAILAATIIGSIAFAVIVWRIPLLRRILFPRSWHDWVTAS